MFFLMLRTFSQWQVLNVKQIHKFVHIAHSRLLLFTSQKPGSACFLLFAFCFSQRRHSRFRFDQLRQIRIGVLPKLQQLFVVLDGEFLIPLLLINLAHEIKTFGIIDGMEPAEIIGIFLDLPQRSESRLILPRFKLALRQRIERPGPHVIRQ